MNIFVKYCEKKYNIQLGYPTIQVGTLAYYREMNPVFSIADPTEQSEKIAVVNYDSKTAEQNVKEMITGISVEESSQLVMENSLVETKFPNCLIFCVSNNDDSNYLENAKKFDKKFSTVQMRVKMKSKLRAKCTVEK